MIINHNMQAMNSHRQLGINASAQAKSTEKLSSGQRINRAGDDAAGLAISEKMRGQIRGLNQASRNAEDGISLIQTAEGALDEVHSILQRMRELAVQSSNGTYTATDRGNITAETDELIKEIKSIEEKTKFNTKDVLKGGTITLQTGADNAQEITMDMANVTAVHTAVDAIDVSTSTAAKAAITIVNTQIESVATQRAKLGAYQNRLEHTIKNVDNSAENLQASESRIRDVDMAQEMMNFTKTNVLNQAAQAMLSQANQLPNQVLQLLR